MSLLELKHVSKAYNEKVLALDDVNLNVEKGEWLRLGQVDADEHHRLHGQPDER